MTLNASPRTLFPCPEWFPHALDPVQDRVLLVRRSEADLRAASFLDDRSLNPGCARTLVGWAQISGSVPQGARCDLQYIFHIGHVGSTLLARLIGELPGALSLREPLVLRTLCEVDGLEGRPESPWDPASLQSRVDVINFFLSRTFRKDQRVVVKGTSFTSEIAHRLLPPDSAALLMSVTPMSYIENILAGEASRQELHQLAGTRLARLTRRLGEAPARLWELNEGQRAALGWACEMVSLSAAAKALTKVRWCDFDHFLADPAAELVAICRHFGLELDPDSASALCAGPIMGRYSKAPEHQYSPSLRRDVLAQSRAQNASAIREGMHWLAAMGSRYGPVAEALEKAA